MLRFVYLSAVLINFLNSKVCLVGNGSIALSQNVPLGCPEYTKQYTMFVGEMGHGDEVLRY